MVKNASSNLPIFAFHFTFLSVPLPHFLHTELIALPKPSSAHSDSPIVPWHLASPQNLHPQESQSIFIAGP